MLFADYLMAGMILGITLITIFILLRSKPGIPRERLPLLKFILKHF